MLGKFKSLDSYFKFYFNALNGHNSALRTRCGLVRPPDMGVLAAQPASACLPSALSSNHPNPAAALSRAMIATGGKSSQPTTTFSGETQVDGRYGMGFGSRRRTR